MKDTNIYILVLFLTLNWTSCLPEKEYEINGSLKQWHTITLTFDGPMLEETSEDNPFLNYRMEATFGNGVKQYTVPGYFAADGDAAETSTESGNKWQVHFTPDTTGIWNFEISFRKGRNIAISNDPSAGEGTAFDGKKGQFEIFPTDNADRDFRGKGRIGNRI